MQRTHKYFFILIIASILIVFFSQFNNVYSSFCHILTDKNDLRVNLSLLNGLINTVSAEPSNKVYININVKDKNGSNVPNSRILLSIDNNIGSLSSQNFFTDSSGGRIVTYTPPFYYSADLSKDNSTINITATIDGTQINDTVNLKLIPVPIALIHGYQQNSSIFDNLYDYLSSKGYDCIALDYDSSLGIAYGAEQLKEFLQENRRIYLQQGILVNSFTLITHSMGGLVGRYYTSSESYIKNSDVNKIIFLSSPHKGSYLASLGEDFFNDKSMEDLVPNSNIFVHSFSNMINKGLNSFIQVGNILSQYDEVITSESASLDEWGIKTEIFNVGDNKFTFDNILSGDILEAPNHKSVLSNKKVFDRILEMLNSNLQYPDVKRK